MEVWHYWAIAALLLVVGEIFTSGFAMICLAIGAVAGAIAAATGAILEAQLIWFAVGTLVAFLAVRPILKRISKVDEIATNADALIGRRAVVSEEINPQTGTGRVAIDGDDWKAISLEAAPIEVGEAVEITAINSVIVTVKRV